MDAVFELAINGMMSFLLIFVRMTGIFVIAPIFGRKNMPTYFKIGFAFMLSLILVNTGKFSVSISYNNIYSYALLIIQEFTVGVILGYVAYLIFSAIYFAGQIIDVQIGFGMVNVIDPMNSTQIPVTANFYYIFAMLIFLLMNGQHMLIKAVYDSYNAIPPGTLGFDSSALLENITRLVKNMMIMGLKISAPIIAAVLVADVALGIIVKTIPQINVFVAGLPIKILVGLIIMLLMIPLFVVIIEAMINNMNDELQNFINLMAPK